MFTSNGKIYKIIRTGIHQESIIMFIRNDQYLNELNWTIIINDLKLVETSIIKTPPSPPPLPSPSVSRLFISQYGLFAARSKL